MQVTKTALSICITGVMVSGPLTAQEENKFTAILGVSKTFGFYKGEDSNVEFMPHLSYDIGNLTLSFDGARYRFNTVGPLQFALGVAPRVEPDFPDTALFAGLDRNATLEGLVAGTYTFGSNARLSLSLQNDVLSEHGGHEIMFSYGRSQSLRWMQIDTQIGLRHRSGDLNTYLVGVTVSEATNGRPAFSPGSTTSPFFSLTATLPMSDRSALISIVTFDYFGDTYRDSPLVGRRYSTSFGFGIAHKF